jgi:hypothetical protein
MDLHYWEWETTPSREKMKAPSIKEIARVLFDNETQQYRFAKAMLLVKEKQFLKLRECPGDLPLSTWKRYLDYAVQLGMLNHENNTYSLANRFSTPAKNFADYYEKWLREGNGNEDLTILFPAAKKGKERPRRTK